MKQLTRTVSVLVAAALAAPGCGGTSSGKQRTADGGAAGLGGDIAAEGGSEQGEGGHAPQAAGASTGSVVNRCGCGNGAMPPPECEGPPTVGAACDEAAFTICRVGFSACYLCFASTVPGCSSSE